MSNVRRLLKRARDTYETYETSPYSVLRLPDAAYQCDGPDLKVFRSSIISNAWNDGRWIVGSAPSPGVNTGVSGAAWYPLDAMEVGTQTYQRVGKDIRVKGIHVAGSFMWNATVAGAFGAVANYALVLDRQPAHRESQTSYIYAEQEEVFFDYDPSTDALDPPGISRYQLLARGTFHFEGDASTGSADLCRPVNIRLNCDIPVQWGEALDAVTGGHLISSNRLVHMVGGAGNTTTFPYGNNWAGVSWSLRTRIYFADS